jgi:hypothetical protein
VLYLGVALVGFYSTLSINAMKHKDFYVFSTTKKKKQNVVVDISHPLRPKNKAG